jgi:hypothetical protein
MSIKRRPRLSESDRIHWWIDGLSLPAITIVFYILKRWLSVPIALSLTIALLLLTFLLFEPRPGSLKRAAVIVILFALVAYILAVVIKLTV